jgi:uncharacterized peroxidase-related enzyme
MAHITTIDPKDAGGRLAEVYRAIAAGRGGIASVHTIQSLDPDSLENHMNLYRSVVFGRSDLSRPQREMMGVVTSAANGCAYCVTHHIEALNHFWKDRERCLALTRDHRSVTPALNPLDSDLCVMALTLTEAPGDAGTLTIRLREHGLSDRGILDAVQVVAYFNFVNRLVLALGCDLEQNPGGYIYE